MEEAPHPKVDPLHAAHLLFLFDAWTRAIRGQTIAPEGFRAGHGGPSLCGELDYKAIQDNLDVLIRVRRRYPDLASTRATLMSTGSPWMNTYFGKGAGAPITEDAILSWVRRMAIEGRQAATARQVRGQDNVVPFRRPQAPEADGDPEPA